MIDCWREAAQTQQAGKHFQNIYRMRSAFFTVRPSLKILQGFAEHVPQSIRVHVSPSLQYSSGSKIVVAERSASVIIQRRSPALVVYADRMRNPCCTENSFSCLSASDTSPQSPRSCRFKNSSGS